MPEELKNFFEMIKSTDQAFLFFRLYHNPNSVLGNKQDMDEAEQEYFELHDFCSLILNNNLIIFLELALLDEKFRDKLDLQLYRKLHFFLWDSIEFRKHHHFQSDEDLMKLLRKEMPVLEYLEKKNLPKTNGSVFGLGCRYDIYTKYKRLFDYNYSQEQVDNYDEQKAHSVRSTLNFKMECIRERMQKEATKKNILRRISEDDYSSDNNDMYLSTHSIQYSEMDGFKFYDATVCKNEFLDIMDELLQKGQISGSALDHASEIIDVSIGVKTYTFHDAVFQRKRLGNDRVNDFDLKRAENLLSEISFYKTNKDREVESGNLKIVKFRQS